MNGKRILVCGGAGFIGSALVARLASMGAQVTATLFTRDPQPRIEGVHYIEADLTARGMWRYLTPFSEPPEIIYMAAGKTGGSGLDPLHFVTDNAIMHLHLFRASAEAGVKRIVALSSTTGYPDIERPKESDYFTGDPHPAYFAPGHTRRFIERLAGMYPQIETVFVRCAGAYGPGDDFDPVSSHVIGATVRKVAAREDPLTIWGDGSATRDGTYIDDLVDALIRCADTPPGAYNVGTGLPMSVLEIHQHLAECAGYAPAIMFDASKPQMIASRVLDLSHTWRTLGWHARTMMREGLRRTLSWYQAYINDRPV